MDAIFRLKETLYLEISQGKAYPLVPSGRIIPATWAQTFTTLFEDQRSFDLHLVRGYSTQIVDNSSLGKWRIGGIPPGPKGEIQIKVEVRVGVDGSVGLRATQKGQTLPVTLLTEPFPKMPLTQRMPTIPLEMKIPEPCPACQQNFVIRYTNWRDEPFAVCLDCGHEFELPETPLAEHKAPWDDLPPELLKTLGIELPHNPGGLDDAELRELQEKGFLLSQTEEPDLKVKAGNIFEHIPGAIFGTPKIEKELTVDDILEMAGEPLAEDQRQNCPKCDAVIARDAKRCEWCGQTL